MDQPGVASCLREVDARRICVIKPSALGDVVQSLPLLPALRARFRAARISWVVNRALAPLLEGHPDLDELILFDRRGTWTAWASLLGQLRRSRFDLVFDLQGLFRTGIMAWATGAPLRIGLESAREGALFACHVLVPETGLSIPAHRRARSVADALGLAGLSLPTRVSISPGDMSWARGELEKLGGPALAVQPGARWVTKRWPPERFAAVASKAARRFGLSTVLLGSSDEERLAAQVEAMIGRLAPSTRVLNLAGRTSLKQLASILVQSTALLTNDSGPMQLAAGLGTPVLGVFTCTSPILSGPPGAQHELVATGVRCEASYRKRCPYRGKRHMACMEELDVERVWAALGRLMKKNACETKAG